MLVSFLLWLPACLVAMSFIEYALHRWVMHQRLGFNGFTLEQHARLHHGRYYKNFDADPDCSAKHVGLLLNPGYCLLMGLPLWGPLLLWSVPLGLAMAAVIMAHAAAWSSLHWEMHERGGAWFAGTAAFSFLSRYHRMHHRRPRVNFNVVLPLFDFVCGTYGGLAE